MTSTDSRKWSRYGSFLYKFRQLGERANTIIEDPHLYFGSLSSMGDKTELGADIVADGTKESIKQHLRDYRQVLERERRFELTLWTRAIAKYEEDINAPLRASRRMAHVRLFEERIEHADKLINSLESAADLDAGKILVEFYRTIKLSMQNASVCCLIKAPTSPKMWEEYADLHRGVCFEFSDSIFVKDKRIDRVEINYSEDGKLHPLEVGYERAYRFMYSTKHSSYDHEMEVRFFLFGSPRPVKTRSAELNSVILGSEALTPVSDVTLEAKRREGVSSLCRALVARNSRRNYEHRTELYVASWVGFQLWVRLASAEDVLRAMDSGITTARLDKDLDKAMPGAVREIVQRNEAQHQPDREGSACTGDNGPVAR